MAVPFGDLAFSAGELSPSFFGRIDVSKFHIGAATLRNCFVGFKGGAYSRAGTAYVGMSKQSPLNGQVPPRLIPFNFSLTQQYVCEFGDNYVRFINKGGYVVEPTVAVSGATKANPCVITANGHGYANGDWVILVGLGGLTELNNNTYIVAGATTNTFQLNTTDGLAVDSSAYDGNYSGGGTVARIYTIPSPYAGSDLAQLKYVQSADVVTIAQANHPPQNLSRFGPLNWSVAPVNIAPTIAAPATCTASATVQPNAGLSPPTLPTAYAYVVTAVNSKTGEESQPSPIANITNGVDMAATNGSNIINWSPVPGAASYNIYRAPTSYNTQPGNSSQALPVPVGAAFGLVGEAFGTQFVDNNATVDFATPPPQFQNPLAPGQVTYAQVTASSSDWTTATCTIASATGSGFIGTPVIINSTIVAVVIQNNGTGYTQADVNNMVFSGSGTSATAVLTIGPSTGTFPSVVAYFQQRRVYANSLNSPDTYWMSQPGAFDNFDTAIPVTAADAITGTPWSGQVNGVQFMIEMPLGLITFTGSSVEQVQASGSFVLSPAAISPSNQQALPQSSIGSSQTLAPIRDNWDILYFEPDNATVRDLAYQLYFNLYTGTDVTFQSSHLTQGHQIVDRTWARKPNYLAWMARDDGLFLSLTFMKEQQVNGWAKHTTQGQVRTVCAITELPVDALYMSVERPVTIGGGGTRYFIERMDNRLWNSAEDPWCVDDGVSPALPAPNANLSATAASGNGVNFVASANVFSGASIGQIIRMGGGIATVTGFVTATTVIGNWLLPCAQTLPDDPNNTPLTQTAGNWSIAVPTNKVHLPYQLAAKQVVGLADGVPVGPLTPDSTGLVTLPFFASDIKVGLAFTAQVQSMYLSALSQPTEQTRRKTINAVNIRCEGSAPMVAGANEIDVSTVYPPPLAVTWTKGLGGVPTNPAQLPPTYLNPAGRVVQPLFTGDIRIPIPSTWARQGQVAAQQTGPVPLNVLAFVIEGLEGDAPEPGLSDRPPARLASPVPSSRWPQPGARG